MKKLLILAIVFSFITIISVHPAYALITDESLTADLDRETQQEYLKEKIILEAQKREQDRLNACLRRLTEASPRCANIEELAVAPDLETPGERQIRETLLVQCTSGAEACVNAADRDSEFSAIENECRRKLAVWENGKCTTPRYIGSAPCMEFYNTCLQDANWDQIMIQQVLGGTANQSGDLKYPIRITPEEYSKLNTPIPYCALTYEGCRDANDVITLLVNIGKMVLSIIGMLAFIMFIYGGFTMILAMGNPERFKKGMQILVAAVVGIIISLSAYLLINFILDALGVGQDFRAL